MKGRRSSTTSSRATRVCALRTSSRSSRRPAAKPCRDDVAANPHRNSRSAPRRQLAGEAAILEALATGEPVALIFLRATAGSSEPAELLRRAASRGVPVRRVAAAVFRRFARGEVDVAALALLGPAPTATLEEVMTSGRGAVWLLAGLAYLTNVGFALRTAEVAGADGVVVDGAFSAADRRTALRASMRADRLMPVLWRDGATAIRAARAAGRRIVAIEDVGAAAPWQVDLTVPLVFVVGGERDGIPPALLSMCDTILRLPMAGFIPSYNVQAAIAAVALERLRQLGA